MQDVTQHAQRAISSHSESHNSSTDWLKFCLWNARSLINKVSQFQSLVYLIEPAVVAVTETWLTNSHFDGKVLFSGFNIFCKDRNSHGGGVLLAVSCTFSVSLFPSPSSLEVLTIRLDFEQPILVSVSPSTNISTFNSLLSYLDYSLLLF